MTWVKLDDQFFRHPKSVAVGKDGRALYIAGLCYCASQLTDGWIAQGALPLVAADANVRPSVARALERFGLWEEGIGGFWVHDYLKYNPSAKTVRDQREKKAAAGAKGGDAAARARALAQADATAGADPAGSADSVPPFPYPLPNPDTGQALSNGLAELRLERGAG